MSIGALPAQASFGLFSPRVSPQKTASGDFFASFKNASRKLTQVVETHQENTTKRYDRASGRLLGEQYDTDLGMYFLRARYMETDRGRFWNQDTFEGFNSSPATLHKYLYVHGDPVNGIDPSGNITLNEALLVVDLLFTVAAVKHASDSFLDGDYRGAALDVGFVVFWGAAGLRKSTSWAGWWLKNRTVRKAYLVGIKEIKVLINTERATGKTAKQIVEAVVKARNKAKIVARSKMHADDVKVLEARNMEKYGHPIGPTVKWLLADKGSYEAVLESAVRTSLWYNLKFLVF